MSYCSVFYCSIWYFACQVIQEIDFDGTCKHVKNTQTRLFYVSICDLKKIINISIHWQIKSEQVHLSISFLAGKNVDKIKKITKQACLFNVNILWLNEIGLFHLSTNKIDFFFQWKPLYLKTKFIDEVNSNHFNHTPEKLIQWHHFLTRLLRTNVYVLF